MQPWRRGAAKHGQQSCSTSHLPHLYPARTPSLPCPGKAPPGGRPHSVPTLTPVPFCSRVREPTATRPEPFHGLPGPTHPGSTALSPKNCSPASSPDFLTPGALECLAEDTSDSRVLPLPSGHTPGSFAASSPLAFLEHATWPPRPPLPCTGSLELLRNHTSWAGH